MIVKVLYTGGGISLSPTSGEGRVNSGYVRLYADEGKILTNNVISSYCIDVKEKDVADWEEINETEIIDDEEIFSILIGEST